MKLLSNTFQNKNNGMKTTFFLVIELTLEKFLVEIVSGAFMNQAHCLKTVVFKIFHLT